MMVGARKRRGADLENKENNSKRASPLRTPTGVPFAERNGYQARRLIVEFDEAQESGGLNLMGLPDVVRNRIMSMTGLQSLGNLALASHETMDMVEGFLTPKFRTSFIDKIKLDGARLTCCERCCPNHIAFMKAAFQTLGRLVKKVTIIRSTADRLKFALGIFEDMKCGNITVTPALAAGWSRFFHCVIRGWESEEWDQAFTMLKKVANFQELASMAFGENPGGNIVAEWELRSMCRRLVLDEELIRDRNNTFIAWLNAILQSTSTVSQAKMLFLIYGPTKAVGDSSRAHFDHFLLDWSLPHTRTLATANAAKVAFQDLGSALTLLFQGNWGSPNLSVLDLLEELTNLPEPWLLDNMSILMLFVSRDLSFAFLRARLDSDRIAEVSWIVYYMLFVAFRLKLPMEKPLKLFYDLSMWLRCSSQRRGFVLGLAHAHYETLEDLRSSGATSANPDVVLELAFWRCLHVKMMSFRRPPVLGPEE